ncbi:MAG: YkvA family protein [Chloroflexota bacterium]
MIERLRQRARSIKRDTYALYLACRDPRVPWYAKVCAGAVVVYALSPIDLIPDFIPVLGYLDDLILVPVGIVLVRRMIPPAILEEHRATAIARFAVGRAASWAGAALVITIWAGIAGLVLWQVV